MSTPQSDDEEATITSSASPSTNHASADYSTNSFSKWESSTADKKPKDRVNEDLPKAFGRYRVVSLLGVGGFGAVYRAMDDKLQRDVAIKVTLGSLLDPSVRQSFLKEAQIVAALDHPNIVPVHDIGQTDSGDFFVVSKLIDGSDLATRCKTDRPDRTLALRIVEQIADALHYAHAKGLIHRDVKPANILLDKSDRPYLADFGISLRESEQRREEDLVGTPAYMSPEQARGQGHRIDNRSDIYCLGVVLYELLTARRPFRSSNSYELLKLIATEEVRSPRIFDETISSEVERICLKSLARRANDRFTVARDFADDIRWVLAHQTTTPGLRPSSASSSVGAAGGTPLTPNTLELLSYATDTTPTGQTRIIPKGLRSFDASDASFFLELLPGPFDREGSPESVRFWKTRIEEKDSEKAFNLGLIYGPSGCGKSSLMKAGILPRLSPKIVSIYVEASAVDTEVRLLRAVRKAIPDAEGDSLAEILSCVRRRKLVPSGGKLLIVLDQFEQWLFAERNYAKAELTDALLQCDCANVQAIVMVRDDFWISVSRFFKEMEIHLIDGNNSGMVDLFSTQHAEKVLGLFGKAYEKLPENPKDWSGDQREFVRQAIQGLSQDEKVISVQIALFADMMKQKSWTTTTLQSVGGVEGVGVKFLEEMFGSRHAPISHRQHQEAVSGLLSSLLPAFGTDIKGTTQSALSLQKAAGYENKPRKFQSLMQILDQSLRLITPVDDVSGEGRSTMRCYQLAHDYLVPSLREWLTRKQRETKRGRAELTLAERTAAWCAKHEAKQLPTLGEWLRIRRFTESAKWRPNEQAVMRASTRYHLQRVFISAATIALIAIGGLAFKHWNDARLMDRDAENLVARIETADFSKLADELRQVISLQAIIQPKLQAALDKAGPDSQERLKLSLGLLSSDPNQVDYLLQRLQTAETPYVKLLIEQLRDHQDKILDSLWNSAQGTEAKAWLPVASALADYDPNNPRWVGIAGKVSEALVRENALRVSIWIDLLRPAAMHLNPELARIYAATPDATRSQTQIDLATEILETYAAKDFSMLHALILTGKPEQFARLFNEYEAFKKEAIDELRTEVARRFEPEENAKPQEIETSRLALIERQANAAVALMRLEDPQPIYEFLTIDRDPEALSQFIYRIRGREVSPSLLIRSLRELEQVATPADTKLRHQHYLRLYGMILGLGEFAIDQLPSSDRDGLIEQLSGMYKAHPSRMIHSAVGWLLRRWGQDSAVHAVDETPLDYDTSGMREWYVVEVEPPIDLKQPINLATSDDPNAIDPIAPIYFTMLVFPGGEYQMGDTDAAKMVTVPGPLAVSDREVTWRQFSPIDGDSHRQSWENQPSFQNVLRGRCLQPDEPAFGVNWFDAVNYCRWLTEAKMPGEENQSYSKKELTPEQSSKKGWVNIEEPQNWEWPMDPSRPGFRLLREMEWEYVARGGMETPYSFGTSECLLAEYGWYDKNSGAWSHRTGLLRPSVGGLFDIHGNLFEWTDDWFTVGSSRVHRGGGWIFGAASCQSAYKDGGGPEGRNGDLGFRVSLVPVALRKVQSGNDPEGPQQEVGR